MFKVCDECMNIRSEWVTLAAAKATADIRAKEYPGQVFFVCGPDGMVIAGYSIH
jgi:hypothetical protein